MAAAAHAQVVREMGVPSRPARTGTVTTEKVDRKEAREASWRKKREREGGAVCV
jgi:hypothetical protein